MTLHGIMVLFWLCTSEGFIMVIYYTVDGFIMVIYYFFWMVLLWLCIGLWMIFFGYLQFGIWMYT